MIKKFYVYFLCVNQKEWDELTKLLKDPTFDEDAWNEAHTQHYEIDIECTEDDYDNKFLYTEFIEELESEYGILDCEGETLDDGNLYVGFNSYEISLENAPIVWDKLVKKLIELKFVK